MEVLVFEPLTTSLGEPGQPFAWAAAGLDGHRSLGVGHWITSPRPIDGWPVDEVSLAIQGYYESELLFRDCFRDAAREFCMWLGQRFRSEILVVATSNPPLCTGAHDVLASILVHDPEHWWRTSPVVIDTRGLATRAGTPDPPWVAHAEVGRLDLAQRRLARGLQALRALPPTQWLAWDPRASAPTNQLVAAPA